MSESSQPPYRTYLWDRHPIYGYPLDPPQEFGEVYGIPPTPTPELCPGCGAYWQCEHLLGVPAEPSDLVRDLVPNAVNDFGGRTPTFTVIDEATDLNDADWQRMVDHLRRRR